jgi:hypothetical protein
MLRVRVLELSFGTLIGDVRGRSGRAWSMALLAALVAVVPLAHASPTDPLWIAGIYDAADADDLVVAATSLESSVESDLFGVLRVSIVAAGPLTAGPAILGATLRSVQARAPPGKS